MAVVQRRLEKIRLKKKAHGGRQGQVGGALERRKAARSVREGGSRKACSSKEFRKVNRVMKLQICGPVRNCLGFLLILVVCVYMCARTH